MGRTRNPERALFRHLFGTLALIRARTLAPLPNSGANIDDFGQRKCRAREMAGQVGRADREDRGWAALCCRESARRASQGCGGEG